MKMLFLGILVGFLALFFRQDQREWKSFSWPLWIAIAWLMAVSTRLVQILVPTGSGFTGITIEGSIEGNLISRNISIALIMLGIMVLLSKKTPVSTLLRVNRGILFLYAYTLLTITWSDYPDVSIKRYIRLFGCLLVASIIASEKDHHKAFEHVFRRFVTICLTLSIFFIKTDRSVGYVIGVHGEHFMAGITHHKNELGILCMFSIVFMSWRILNSLPSINYYDVVLTLLSAYMLSRARAMTALVSALLGITLIAVMRLTKGNIKAIANIGVFLAVLALPILILSMNSPSSAISGAFFSATGKDATLTGRLPMWEELVSIGNREIILGSGYESFWIENYREIWAKFSFLPTNAHNGYIEVLVNLGLIGLIIMLVSFIRLLISLGSKASLSRPFGHWYLVTLVLVIITSITEANLVKLTLSWCLFLIIMASSEKDRLPLPV